LGLLKVLLTGVYPLFFLSGLALRCFIASERITGFSVGFRWGGLVEFGVDWEQEQFLKACLSVFSLFLLG
jgi:hypothetical protein